MMIDEEYTVEDALEVADELSGVPYSRRSEALLVLAAEVRRLRERETALLNAGRSAQARVSEVVQEGKTTVDALERVMALSEKWRTDAINSYACADELEAALYGEP